MSRQPDEQSDLFRIPQPRREYVRPAPYQPASDTSKAAAREVTNRSAAMRENILNAIAAAGERGTTRKELEQSTGMLTQTLCARLNELEHEGRIRKRTRLNRDNQEEKVKRDGCSVYEPTRKAA